MAVASKSQRKSKENVSLQHEAQDAVDSIEFFRVNAGDDVTLQNIIWAAIVIRGLYVAQRIEPLNESGSQNLQNRLSSLTEKEGEIMNKVSILHACSMLALKVAGDVLEQEGI